MADKISRRAKDLAKAGIPIPDAILSEASKRGVDPQVLMKQFMDRGGDKLMRMAIQAQEMDDRAARKESLRKVGRGLKKVGSTALKKGIPGAAILDFL